jgi:hypothetical protein
MFVAQFLGFISCAYALNYLGRTGFVLDPDDTLYMEKIESPINYSQVVEGKSIKKLEIFHTKITKEIATDLYERFIQWPELSTLKFSGNFDSEASARIFAKAIAFNSQICDIGFYANNRNFFIFFLQELTKVPAHLKKLTLHIDHDFEQSAQFEQISKLENAFSILEEFNLNSNPENCSIVFKYLLKQMTNLKKARFIVNRNSKISLMQSIQYPEKIEKFDIFLSAKIFRQPLEILSKMTSLKELSLETDCLDEGQKIELVSTLKSLSIEKINLSGDLGKEFLKNLVPIKTLKQVSYEINDKDLVNFREFTFLAKNQDFPFQVQGHYYVYACKGKKPEEKPLDEIFPKGITMLKFSSYMNDKILSQFQEWLKNGNGAEIEDFEMDANRFKLHNFCNYLVHMPKLKRLSILNTNDGDKRDFIERHLTGASHLIEEITITGRNGECLEYLGDKFRKNSPNFKKFSYERKQMYTQYFAPLEQKQQ